MTLATGRRKSFATSPPCRSSIHRFGTVHDNCREIPIVKSVCQQPVGKEFVNLKFCSYCMDMIVRTYDFELVHAVRHPRASIAN
jgi:hypothetical protein